MGLTASSTGHNTQKTELNINTKGCDITVALAGNPNVGKSTLFNELTGLNQHTGNWAGKTVSSAAGISTYNGKSILVIDLPGTYSLKSNSPEEEVAGDYICFGNADCVAVVCDATCLERNLNLVIQTREIFKNVVVCVNLIDEAKRKSIDIDYNKLSEYLGVPVIPMSARKNKGIRLFKKTILASENNDYFKIKYPQNLESALNKISAYIENNVSFNNLNPRWIALKLIENDKQYIKKISKHIGCELESVSELNDLLSKIRQSLSPQQVSDAAASCSILSAEYIYGEVVESAINNRTKREEKIDKILTGKKTGIPIMLGLLFIIFWLTISGSNYPSEVLSSFLFKAEDWLEYLFLLIHAPEWLIGVVVHGGYRVLAWVVSVMLPPMAIFFPLFTILEDLGYLPRVAFNLDHYFQKAETCGKQALTICMGFGCNAAGVVGCRIIDSPRERLIATLTNNFVPCNGRYPTLIAIISMFFIGGMSGILGTLSSTLLLLSIIVLGIMITFLVSKLLSRTILKGVPSSFALELPPFRKPQIGKIIVRSMVDRTLFVLGRAVVASIPAGIIIWILANVTLSGETLLTVCSDALNPFATLFGLDGVILMAFILGFPANEIVIPIIIMAYMASGTLIEYGSLQELKMLLVNNGWTYTTAISMMLFCLFHWPCATTCMTVKHETKSLKWTVISAVLPTAIGLLMCFIFNMVIKLF